MWNHPGSSDTAGVTYWSQMMVGQDKIGTTDLYSYVSIDYVAKGFVESPEFEWLCMRYSIKRGTYALTEPRDQNILVNRFVGRNYRNAFNRDPDVDGMNDWCNRLLRGGVTGAQMVHSFIFSYEMTLNPNWAVTNPGGWIEVLYKCYMGRASDASGFTYWYGVYNTLKTLYGDMAAREVLALGFASSPEFAELRTLYGIY